MPRPTMAADQGRWYKPTLGWHVNEWPDGMSKAEFVSQCGIALGKWYWATGLRFEYGGDDIIFYMSGALPTFTSARSEWPPAKGESRTCNIWLAKHFGHTLHNDASQAQGQSCNLLFELMHEIGHVLGFEHTSRKTSIMYSSLQYPFVQELDEMDLITARKKYPLEIGSNTFEGLRANYLAMVTK